MEHAFIYCWDAIFVWDILRRTLKEKSSFIPHEAIRFLQVDVCNIVPYDRFVKRLFSFRKARMEFRPANAHIKSARGVCFIEVVTQVQFVYCRTSGTAPDWARLFKERKQM